MFRFTKGGKKGRKNVVQPKTMAAMGNGVKGTSKSIAKKKAIEAGTASGGKARRRRFRPGTVALREIRKYQKSVKHLIPEANFKRVVREIMQDISSERTQLTPDGVVDEVPMKMTRGAFEAFWEGAETYIVDFLRKSQILSLHRKGETLMAEDMRMIGYLDGIYSTSSVGATLSTIGSSSATSLPIASNGDVGSQASAVEEEGGVDLGYESA